mmetsp:Transcript_20902/g.65770  ORF Transcript_20902/g.65770 Transcript_20902/m.65770 type:complete len:228 (+) Transcript_20902:743-1426(+)
MAEARRLKAVGMSLRAILRSAPRRCHASASSELAVGVAPPLPPGVAGSMPIMLPGTGDARRAPPGGVPACCGAATSPTGRPTMSAGGRAAKPRAAMGGRLQKAGAPLGEAMARPRPAGHATEARPDVPDGVTIGHGAASPAAPAASASGESSAPGDAAGGTSSEQVASVSSSPCPSPALLLAEPPRAPFGPLPTRGEREESMRPWSAAAPPPTAGAVSKQARAATAS